MYTVQIKKEQPLERKAVSKTSVNNVGGDSSSAKKQPVKAAKKPGRNDPCPCGKMKPDGSRRLKYKECCGRDN
jgi:preprotein translocase subunit SecA